VRAVPPADEPDHENSTLSEQADDSLVHHMPSVPALVLLWLADEPERVGEVCLIPAGEPWGAPRIFGRGESRTDDSHRRVHLQRQHGPGSPSASIVANRHISRTQLVLRAQSSGRIAVENSGRCHAYKNGEPFDSTELEPGDVLRLGQQALFLCARRPVWLHAGDSLQHEFGRADAYGLVGESSAIRELRANIRAASAAGGHVLLLGETGTGKELVARAVHVEAFGREPALVARNAATLPESLIDAELFGNARNYPNAGMPERPGLIGQAHRSSLFLDEFGELSRALQVHLLRVLDAGEYQRLGESTSRRAEFRLIAATNRPADALRDDVLARFKTRIVVPSLSQRREDIPLLARHVLGDRGATLPLGFVERLVRHEYVGNVRELQALLTRHSSDPRYEAWDDAWRRIEPSNAVDPSSLTREQVQECLERHGWVQEKAWRALGLSSRHALARLLRRFNIASPGGDR
jgi:transcriptional regulator of acetoin/glycerol metabolism